MSPAKKEFIIISVVFNEFKVPICSAVRHNTRRPETTLTPTFLSIYLIRINTFQSMSAMGRVFGYSNFGVKWGHVSNWVSEKIISDPDFKHKFNRIQAILPEIFKIHK